MKKYELDMIIACIEQVDGEFGLGTRDEEALKDCRAGDTTLRMYNRHGRETVFLQAETLIDKVKALVR